jgi:Zn-finger nucleic acid-binding protein
MTASQTPGLACPRCQQPLGPIRHRGVELEGCAGCKATLVPQVKLTPLLEATSVDLLASFDPDSKLDAVDKKAGGTACPRCARAMEIGDYCGASLVFFDRCTRCNLLWVGAEELGAMTLMWARMESRAARLKAASEELDEELAALGKRGRMRAVERAVMFALFHI